MLRIQQVSHNMFQTPYVLCTIYVVGEIKSNALIKLLLRAVVLLVQQLLIQLLESWS